MNILTREKSWGSSYTRGAQIADALGCRYNQSLNGFDETLIYVKRVPDDNAIKTLRKMPNVYFDLVDHANTIDVMKNFPTVKLIVSTDVMKDFLHHFIDNEIVVISEHSCNFARDIRQERKVKVVGHVGDSLNFHLDQQKLKTALADIGLDFRFLACERSDKNTYQEICRFYKEIDIQIAFRLPDRDLQPPIYRNPLKIINAGSFRIPTVAYPEIAYRLCAGGVFLEAWNFNEVITECKRLKDDESLYDFYADQSYAYSKQFDIKNAAFEYAKLSPNEVFDIDENVTRMRSA